MKIAVSADCFGSFTSGFPVRGMLLALVKERSYDDFVLFYSRKPKPLQLSAFYNEIEELPNVSLQVIDKHPKWVAILNLLAFSSIKLDETFDVFINPGNPEYCRGFKGLQINSIADFSTIKGYSTGKYSFFLKYHSYWFRKWVFNRIDKIVCISKYTQKDVCYYYPNVVDKTTVVYNGIADFWLDSVYAKNKLTDSFLSKSYFIWWGNVSKRKNINNLFKAYSIALSKNSELPSLLIVGNFQEDQTYLKKELSSKILHIPFQDDYTIKTLVKNSKGLLFPSHYEGFGLPVIESFSQGIPVACSDVTSLPEVSNGLSLLFDPNDVEKMAETILVLNTLDYDEKKLRDQANVFTFRESARLYSGLINTNK